MSITIHLRPETERRLAERAHRAGLTLDELVRQIVEREGADGDRATAGAADAGPRSVPSFEEMTGPVARAVEATGMTEEGLGNFFEGVLMDVRAEKRARQGRTE